MNKVVCYAHPDAPLIEDYRAGDMICSECGLVVGDRVIDVGSEWRTFSNEKSGVDPSRVGGPGKKTKPIFYRLFNNIVCTRHFF